MAIARFIKLNSGHKCPLIGYGTWQVKDPATLTAGIKKVIRAGYRHIDTAHSYENEHIIGDCLESLFKVKMIRREDLFLTTKIYATQLCPATMMDTLKSQLAKLKTGFVDLYLVHFPAPLKPPTEEGQIMRTNADGIVEIDTNTKLEDVWVAMEKCAEAGLARSIGVSNFNISQIERLLKSKIKPAMNQVESHPGFQNTKLIEFCQKHGVAVTGFSAFGSPGSLCRVTGELLSEDNCLEDERILAIGKKYGKNAAQVILRWQLQRGIVVIPKSVTPSRIVENFQVWDFELTENDMKAMAEIDLNRRLFWWNFPGINAHPEFPHILPDGGSC